MKEIWKDVYKYEGIYQVSNLGNIKSLNRIVSNINGQKYFVKGKQLKPRIPQNGYARVKLSKDGIKKEHSLARLVYKAFNPNFDYDDLDIFILNRNDNKLNNELENLYPVKRENNPNLFENKKQVVCINTNKSFNTIQKAEKHYNIGSGSISRCCQGKSKSAGKIILDDGTVYKLLWKYID